MKIRTPQGQIFLLDELHQLDVANAASHSGDRSAMDAKPCKAAYELADMIVERASVLHDPWPAAMAMFIFDDADGWSASISRPVSEVENFYRTRTSI